MTLEDVVLGDDPTWEGLRIVLVDSRPTLVRADCGEVRPLATFISDEAVAEWQHVCDMISAGILNRVRVEA